MIKEECWNTISNIGYEEKCYCPYCNVLNFDNTSSGEHNPYEIWKCVKCGKNFGTKIRTKTIFIYKTEKIL